MTILALLKTKANGIVLFKQDRKLTTLINGFLRTYIIALYWLNCSNQFNCERRYEMLEGAKRLLLRFAEKVLDVDDTVEPVGHMKFLEDYSSKILIDPETEDVIEFLKSLKKKHLVDEIVVSTLNGSSIASTNGDSVSQAITSAALFNYVKSELPRSEVVMVKSNGWHMIFMLNKRLFMVKAASDLHTVELKALGRDIEKFLQRKGLN